MSEPDLPPGTTDDDLEPDEDQEAGARRTEVIPEQADEQGCRSCGRAPGDTHAAGCTADYGQIGGPEMEQVTMTVDIDGRGYAFTVEMSDAPDPEHRREENLKLAGPDALETVRTELGTHEMMEAWPQVANYYGVDRDDLLEAWGDRYGLGVALEALKGASGTAGRTGRVRSTPARGLQGFMDAMSASWQADRSVKQLTLGELIEKLEGMKETEPVKGIGEPHSYRGYYTDLAFNPEERALPAGLVLARAKGCVDRVFRGYKGGQYRMGEDTPLWIAPRGTTGREFVDLDTTGTVVKPVTRKHGL